MVSRAPPWLTPRYSDTTKTTLSGHSERVAYAVSSMRGWRESTALVAPRVLTDIRLFTHGLDPDIRLPTHGLNITSLISPYVQKWKTRIRHCLD